MFRLLLLLLREETTIILTPSWIQPLFQLDQATPDLIIRLLFSLVALTTSKVSLFNADLLKIP